MAHLLTITCPVPILAAPQSTCTSEAGGGGDRGGGGIEGGGGCSENPCWHVERWAVEGSAAVAIVIACDPALHDGFAFEGFGCGGGGGAPGKDPNSSGGGGGGGARGGEVGVGGRWRQLES